MYFCIIYIVNKYLILYNVIIQDLPRLKIKSFFKYLVVLYYCIKSYL